MNVQKLEKTLVILILILLGVAAILAFQTWRTQAPVRPVPSIAQQLIDNNPVATSVWAGQTAKEAYQLATVKGQTWSPDIQLVTATATYPPGTNLQTGLATWTFTYYSSLKSSNILIAVADTHVSIVSEKKHNGSTPNTDVSNSWAIDSPQLIQSILDAGGETFLNENPDTTLIVTLANKPTPYWETLFFAEQSGNTLNIKIDAVSGTRNP